MLTLKAAAVVLAMFGAAAASALTCTAHAAATATGTSLATDPGHSWADYVPHGGTADLVTGAGAT